MKLPYLLKQLEKLGVTGTHRPARRGKRIVYDLVAKLPCPPFAEGTMGWYSLALEPGQEFVSEEEVEAIKFRLWHGSATFGGAAN